jgi:hypothetical protein
MIQKGGFETRPNNDVSLEKDEIMSTTDDHSEDQEEKLYPGIRESIDRYKNSDLPVCKHCGSKNTAVVQIGIMGRTILLAGSTSKIKLLINGPKPGTYFCNDCKKFFG